MIKLIDESFSPKKYNQIANHPLQSWEWGEARTKMGIKLIRLRQNSNVFQMTIHPIPFTSYKIGYLPRSVWPSDEVLRFLYNYGQTNNVIFIKLEPYIERQKLEISKSELEVVRSTHPLFPAWTQILDLTKSEDELFKNLKSKTRYNIRLAQKKGVYVVLENNQKGFEAFSKLYFETCQRQHYRGHNLTYHKIVWQTLKDTISHLLIAYFEKTPLAAYELFSFKDRFYYVYGGTSDRHRNLMASNLLMWEALKIGKELGAKTFDMWGSLPPNFDQNHDWAGFTRFKQGYGTQFIEFIGSFDLIIRPSLYRLYSFTQKIRSKFLSFS